MVSRKLIVTAIITLQSLVAISPLSAEDKDQESLVGKRVYWVENASAFDNEGNRFDRGLLAFPETVVAVDGDRVSFGRAWMLRDDVLLPDEAIAYFTKAIEKTPESVRSWNSRGGVYIDQKKYDEAIKDFSQALRIDPRFAAALSNRGVANQRSGKYEGALKDFEAAVALNDDDGLALNNLAWLQATCPDERFRDGKAAVKNATRACEMQKWEGYDELLTLSAAYAEAGDFDSAIKWAQKALSKVKDPQRTDEANHYLAKYKDRKPYREVIDD